MSKGEHRFFFLTSLSLAGSLFQGLELGGTHQQQSVLSPETHGSDVLNMGTVCQQHKPLKCSCLWGRRLSQHRRHPQQSLDRSPCGSRLVLSTEWASPLRSSAGGTPQHSLFVLETLRSSSGNLKGCGWWEGTGRRVVLQMCSAQHSSKHRLASLSVWWGGNITGLLVWWPER